MNDAYHEALSTAIAWTSPSGIARRRETPQTNEELYALYTSDGEERRLVESRFAWDMYRGDQLRYIPRLPGESHTEFRRRPHKQMLNVTRVVIDVLSQLYKRPVERHILGPQNLQDRARDIFERNALDRLLAAADRLARLQGVAAVFATHEQGRVQYWPWPAHRLAVVPDPENPRTPAAILAFAAGDGFLCHGWTPLQSFTVAGGRVIREHAHDLGRIPFVFVHDRLPVDGFWVEGRGRSLAWANNEINAKLSELGHTVAMQGFGVMEIVNPDPAQDIAIGPARAIRFQVGGGEPYGVSFKSPNAPIRELIDDVEFLLRTLLKTQRVPDSVLSVQPLSHQSGLSILAQQTPVLEDRVERRQVFRALEHELFDLTLDVLRVHEGVAETGELHVDYPEPELEQSARERIHADDWRLRHGLVTPWELMMRDDPDRFPTPEAAREAWRENMKANPEREA